MRFTLAAILLIALHSPTLADLQVRFDEGAPKDRFTITNVGHCEVGPTALSIDLSGSPYGLIFDVSSAGAGVEVFQPFALTDGGNRLVTVPRVRDGDNKVTLDLKGLKPKEIVSFTIDVDDTANSREITVSNTEIAGAKIVAQTASETLEAAFQNDATATLGLPDCAS